MNICGRNAININLATRRPKSSQGASGKESGFPLM